MTDAILNLFREAQDCALNAGGCGYCSQFGGWTFAQREGGFVKIAGCDAHSTCGFCLLALSGKKP